MLARYQQCILRGEHALIRHYRGVQCGGDRCECRALFRRHGLLDEGRTKLFDVSQPAKCFPGLHSLIVVDANLGIRWQNALQPCQSTQIIGVFGEAGLHLEQSDAIGTELPYHVGVLREIRVRHGKAERNFVAHTSAQQLTHRHAECFADDIEQRHLHGRFRLGAMHDGAVRRGEQRLDAERICAKQQWPQVDVQCCVGCFGRTGEHGPWRGLAPAGDACIGVETQNDVRAGDNVADAMRMHRAHRDAHRENRHVGNPDL